MVKNRDSSRVQMLLFNIRLISMRVKHLVIRIYKQRIQFSILGSPREDKIVEVRPIGSAFA